MKTNTDELLIAALASLGASIWVFTSKTTGDGVDPTINEGPEFKTNVFKMRSYNWNCETEDDDGLQPVNFKYKDIEVRWYKYLGRGMEVNKELTPDEINEMLNDCVESLAEKSNG